MQGWRLRIEPTPAEPTAGQVVNLLELVQLGESGDAIQGQWSREPDGLHSTRASIMRLPYRPPAEYDFTIEFTINKVEPDGYVNQICSVGDAGFCWLMGRFGNAICDFANVDGFYNPPGRRAPPVFENGKTYQSVVSVRRRGVRRAWPHRAFAPEDRFPGCALPQLVSRRPRGPGNWNDT